MRRRHMIGTEDKTLCGWSLTTGELQQLKSVSNIHVTCKRCIDKLESYSDDKILIKQKGNALNG